MVLMNYAKYSAANKKMQFFKKKGLHFLKRYYIITLASNIDAINMERAFSSVGRAPDS